MALTATTVWEVQTGGSNTANGGNFDPSNANMSSNGAVSSANTSSPVFSSASYTFVAGDVGNWLFNKTLGIWAKIASVSGGNAALTANIGTTVNTSYVTNTTVGVSASSTLSSQTWTIDYSQTASPTTANTLTGLTSAGAGLVVLCTTSTVAMIGNGIQITGGTNFNTGIYNVSNVSIGVNMTLVGPTNADSGVGASGTANVGGALASLNTATANSVSGGNFIFVASGTYNVTSAIILSAGQNSAVLSTWGYHSIRGDNDGTKPIIQCNASSVTLFTPSMGNRCQLFKNLYFSGNAQTSSKWFSAGTNSSGSGSQINVVNCVFDGFSTQVQTANGMESWVFEGCEIKNLTSSFSASASVALINCYAHGCTSVFATATATLICENCIFSSITGATTDCLIFQASSNNYVNNCTFYNIGRDAITVNAVTTNMQTGVVSNCIFDTIGRNVVTYGTASAHSILWSNNATHSITGTGITGVKALISPAIVLGGIPFNNAASGDFSLNNTASAGTLCRATGIPGVFPGGLTTGFLDIGAVQHKDLSGIFSRTNYIIQPLI